MPPIIIIITPGAILAIAVLVIAITVLHMAFTRRPALPRRHGLRDLD